MSKEGLTAAFSSFPAVASHVRSRAAKPARDETRRASSVPTRRPSESEQTQGAAAPQRPRRGNRPSLPLEGFKQPPSPLKRTAGNSFGVPVSRLFEAGAEAQNSGIRARRYSSFEKSALPRSSKLLSGTRPFSSKRRRRNPFEKRTAGNFFGIPIPPSF